MTEMAGLHAEVDVIASTGKAAMALQGTHEGYLASMLGVQDELQAAVKSPAGGMAIQQTMTGAYEAGKALSVSLQEIITVLQESGVKIDVSDMDAAAQLNNATALGGSGKVDLSWA